MSDSGKVDKPESCVAKTSDTKKQANMTNNNSSNKKEHGKEDFGIAVLGGLGCGKTAVVLHKLHEKFEEKQDETIWDTHFTEATVNNKKYGFSLHDTSGNAEYAYLRQQWINGSNGFILVFDLTNPKSLQDLKPFIQEIRTCKEKQMLSLENRKKYNLPFYPIVLVGNKLDSLEDDAKSAMFAQATEFAKQQLQYEGSLPMMSHNKLPLVAFTSASFLGLNVDNVFSSIFAQCVQYKELAEEEAKAKGETKVEEKKAKRWSLFNLIAGKKDKSTSN